MCAVLCFLFSVIHYPWWVWVDVLVICLLMLRAVGKLILIAARTHCLRGTLNFPTSFSSLQNWIMLKIILLLPLLICFSRHSMVKMHTSDNYWKSDFITCEESDFETVMLWSLENIAIKSTLVEIFCVLEINLRVYSLKSQLYLTIIEVICGFILLCSVFL